MSQNTLTHKDLAALLGVSETTVKSYRRKFPGCIPVASKGKPIRFPESAAAVALRIRDLFEIGMSVEEVRTRLTREFDWIVPEAPGVETPRKGAKGAEQAEMAPELTVGVSNMAKSMVSMNQQQKAILERMRGIEGMLEELGLKGGPVDADSLRRASQEAAGHREERLEARLDRLDGATEGLAGTVSSLAEQLGRFLGQRAKAREERETAARARGETGGNGQEYAAPAREPARVIPLRAPEHTERAEPGRSEPRVGDGSLAEPPRQFFTLPLGIRTAQGEHVNPRGRGRFSLNDLKAMLIYGHTPPNHFTLRWEAYGQGWWLTLEQESQSRAFALLLMEVVSQKGETVVEILQLKRNNEAVHPAEIRTIIDGLGE